MSNEFLKAGVVNWRPDNSSGQTTVAAIGNSGRPRVMLSDAVLMAALLVAIGAILVSLCELFWGPDATSLENLAVNLHREKQSEFAVRPLIMCSLWWREVMFGPDDPTVAQALKLLAALQKQDNQLEDFESSLKRAAEIQWANYTPSQPISMENQAISAQTVGIGEIFNTNLVLSDFYLKHNRYRDAEVVLERLRNFLKVAAPTTIEQDAEFYRQYKRLYSLLRKGGCPVTRTMLPTPEQTYWHSVGEIRNLEAIIPPMAACIRSLQASYFYRSSWYLNSQRYSEASANLATCLALDPEQKFEWFHTPIFWNRFAMTEEILHKDNSADRAYRQALNSIGRIQRTDFGVISAVTARNYGAFLNARGKAEEAAKMYKIANEFER
jgi:tetratricopeptide (TPR) repeat protein